LHTTARSIILVSMGVTDIGRKSECCTGVAAFGTGWILASVHCVGTADVQSDKLKRYETGLQNTGAATRRNHDGSPSSPAEVDLKASSMRNVSHSLTHWGGSSTSAIDCFRIGAAYSGLSRCWRNAGSMFLQ